MDIQASTNQHSPAAVIPPSPRWLPPGPGSAPLPSSSSSPSSMAPLPPRKLDVQLEDDIHSFIRTCPRLCARAKEIGSIAFENAIPPALDYHRRPRTRSSSSISGGGALGGIGGNSSTNGSHNINSANTGWMKSESSNSLLSSHPDRYDSRNIFGLDQWQSDLGIEETHGLLLDICSQKYSEDYHSLRRRQNADWACQVVDEGRQLLSTDWKQALSKFEHALEIDQDCVEALVARGIELVKQRQLDSAAQDFKAALRIDKQHPQARLEYDRVKNMLREIELEQDAAAKGEFLMSASFAPGPKSNNPNPSLTTLIPPNADTKSRLSRNSMPAPDSPEERPSRSKKEKKHSSDKKKKKDKDKDKDKDKSRRKKKKSYSSESSDSYGSDGSSVHRDKSSHRSHKKRRNKSLER
ncbi:uncharacterized protein BJ171DRAFT_199170 [Polychytrium aggregatum]|uniref:uncharacterized protein n=1 Tax=Polychytrium aggregatum TaxID=110093 RepID=UPI0022FE62A4|nr:uncharacterized protein BJ171DRAFT_199170 [Polychytrium aggregatum]KAI9199845.1 hypothetical protein BJ171DRAFT_199170 [Polychytrium aggregatum]